MEARIARTALVAAVLLIAMGARSRTPNFVVEAPDPALAEQVARAAETWRRDLAVAWLGKAMPNWSRPCPVTVRAGADLGAGAVTNFTFHDGEVFDWRMTVQGSVERILDSVLPHEITHMIFASHFRRPVPRWADEGGATSVEHAAERNKHRKMLWQFLQTGRGIALNRMFAIKEYAESPAGVMPLYAQSYSLTEFLIQQGGQQKFVRFVGDGMDSDDWSGAIRRHYGVDGAGSLQTIWLAWVRRGSPSLKRTPAAAPSPEMIATNQRPARPVAKRAPERAAVVATARQPRPQPNLLYRQPKQLPAYAPGSAIASGTRDRTALLQLATVAARPLPSSGWHPPGSPPPPPVAAPPTAATPPASQPIHNQVTRPQPYQRPRQVILEWSAK
ncbi:MAG: hypothetical protein HQ567_23200 [Candidatus Nealsonbacteria bacterium]|nr:hypothetical protein [Candidatus Nealsonbacteria bacterium]